MLEANLQRHNQVGMLTWEVLCISSIQIENLKPHIDLWLIQLNWVPLNFL